MLEQRPHLPDLITITTADKGAHTVLTVHGELDAHTAPRLRAALRDQLDTGERHLVVDLDGVDFLDSTALGVLVGARARLTERAGTLRLVCTRPQVLKILRITGLDAIFPTHPDLASATATV